MRWSAVGLVLVVALMAPAVVRADERGWDYLIEKLAGDGVPRDRVVAVFRDDRVDPFDGLYFSLRPRESHALYRPLRTQATAAKARRCLDAYRPSFEAAEQRYGVPASLVASIIQVESGCGANTGRSRILPALARLAMAGEPANLARNVDRLTLIDTTGSLQSVSTFARWRAGYLEDTFYPEVKAAFEIADRMRIDPLEMRGSGSGAFGIPQFLPRSYLWYAVDGDQDGHVSLYHPADAVPSCAHYLQQYGWRAGLSRSAQRNVIWGYNRSDAYIDTVLWLADEVHSPTPEPPRKPTVRSAKRRRSTGKVTRAKATTTPRKTTRTPSAASKSKKKTTHAKR